ncbi:MAG: hypothetical protein RMK51_00190 [Meiothermus sp.]|uniref:hypothetical protein n=1 Tax=Meiothermus sp. TaxID=1955249 RepID=UPI0025FBFD6D|nr:hypothetical protein [Meiothermus sp.]MCS7069227.1 hypothetical protein [Meiothermus sp.]MDW8424323.1 hypothetical protein [Meiothermus sp.]
MLAVRAQHRQAWTGLLAALVFLVSSQYPLRDPRTDILPVSFLPDLYLCSTHPGGSGSSPANPHPNHSQQPHCPLCILGGFSDGPQPLVSAPTPNPRPLSAPQARSGPKPELNPVFPLLNRGPPGLH